MADNENPAKTRSTSRQRPVRDAGPKAVSVPDPHARPSETSRAQETQRRLEAQEARNRAALEVTATRERREIAITAAALLFRGHGRRSVQRTLDAAAEFERYIDVGR